MTATMIRKTPSPVKTFEGKDAPLTNIQTIPAISGTTKSPEVILIPPNENPPKKEEYTITFWEKINNPATSMTSPFHTSTFLINFIMM